MTSSRLVRTPSIGGRRADRRLEADEVEARAVELVTRMPVKVLRQPLAWEISVLLPVAPTVGSPTMAPRR